MAFQQSDHPELWTFLETLRRGETFSGSVAAIERFGVFVALDDGPAHPIFPGVGFITIPELAWQRFDAATDIVEVGQRVSCEFLQFDTWNLEARLSLRATQPDPFQAFADRVSVGEELTGQVTKVLPFGVLVRVAEGIEGLLRTAEGESAGEVAVQFEVGAVVTVVVAVVDRKRRTLGLSSDASHMDMWQ
jgi:ribosomal protein S1